MSLIKKLPSLLLIFCLIFAAQALAQESDILQKLEEIAIIDQKVMMPMRDGIRLATDIYRPKTDQPVPVIFVRTPYNFNLYQKGKLNTRTLQSAYDAVSRGYAYVIQNERGRFFSEGEWDILGVPLTDGYDAFSWLESQSWSNGKIGTQGCSSTAEWQMAVASLDHPAHAALIPQGFGAGVGRIGKFYEQGNWFRGGAQQMLFTSWLYSTQNDKVRPMLPPNTSQEDLQRIQRFYDMAPQHPAVDWSEAFTHLPVQDIIKNVNGSEGIYEKMIRTKPNDEAWYQGGLYHDDMPFEKPGFWFVSWYDVATTPNLAMYNHIAQNAKTETGANNQYLVISPTLHCAYKRATENTIVGEMSVGDARLNYDELTFGWFDMWLKGEQSDLITNMPKVKYYTMGANKWQSADTWPPKEAKMTPFYLNSEGNANTRNGNGTLATKKARRNNPDTFTYDPLNPVKSYGGNVCCTGNAIQGGAFDQSEMELRDDILVYTSPPLQEGLEVSGFIEATIFVSSDAKDTDFTLKLIDVYPDGKAYNLDETIQRVRYREGYDKEVWMENGKVYQLDFTPLSTSNYFAPGHQIRIEISSSNFPRFDRNLNTGGNNFDESEPVTATNQVHHSSQYPSVIKLPIVKSTK